MTIAIDRVGPSDLIRAVDWNEMADAIEALEKKARELLAQADAYRELSVSLAHDAPK